MNKAFKVKPLPKTERTSNTEKELIERNFKKVSSNKEVESLCCYINPSDDKVIQDWLEELIFEVAEESFKAGQESKTILMESWKFNKEELNQAIKSERERIEKIILFWKPEDIAKLLHNIYEDEAKKNKWNTQDICKVRFEDLPEANKKTMINVAIRI